MLTFSSICPSSSSTFYVNLSPLFSLLFDPSCLVWPLPTLSPLSLSVNLTFPILCFFLHIPDPWLCPYVWHLSVLRQQPIRPAWLLQAPAEFLGHDIAHPVAATADAGAASGAGAAGAAETTGLSVPTNHSGPDSCHQCQHPGQPITCRTGADGGAEGKKQQLCFFAEEEIWQHVWLSGCIKFPPLKLEAECVTRAVRTVQAQLYL